MIRRIKRPHSLKKRVLWDPCYPHSDQAPWDPRYPHSGLWSKSPIWSKLSRWRHTHWKRCHNRCDCESTAFEHFGYFRYDANPSIVLRQSTLPNWNSCSGGASEMMSQLPLNLHLQGWKRNLGQHDPKVSGPYVQLQTKKHHGQELNRPAKTWWTHASSQLAAWLSRHGLIGSLVNLHRHWCPSYWTAYLVQQLVTFHPLSWASGTPYSRPQRAHCTCCSAHDQAVCVGTFPSTTTAFHVAWDEVEEAEWPHRSIGLCSGAGMSSAELTSGSASGSWWSVDCLLLGHVIASKTGRPKKAVNNIPMNS